MLKEHGKLQDPSSGAMDMRGMRNLVKALPQYR